MSNPLVQSWERLRRHRAVRGAAAFGRWWRDELIEGLPENWRAHLKTEQDQLFLRRDGEMMVIGDGQGRERARVPRGEDPAVVRQSVRSVLDALGEDHPEVRFLLARDEVLVRQVTLPAAAEESLRQVLTFEMDRHTPFSADQVHFDARVVERLAGGTKIRVELYLLRRADGDGIARLCAERGLELHAVDVAAEDGHPLGVNLLPVEQRAPLDRRQARLNLALAGLFLLLLYGVLWQSVASREAALERYRERLSGIRAEASEVIDLRSELTEAIEAAQFLAGRKRAEPPVMNLLVELTRQLPDETYLQRLQINEEVLQISGETPEAAQLVTLLEQSPCLSRPNIKGAVTPHPQSGKERFTIEAQIRTGTCSHGPTAS